MDEASEAAGCQLPDDLLLRVLSLLDLPTLALVGSVCVDWARVSSRDELWSPFARFVNNRVPGLSWKQCEPNLFCS
jgi:hypothetical protein